MPGTDFEKFLYRLHALLACGAALTLAAYTLHFAVKRVPVFRNMLTDFDIALPATTQILFRVPWLPAAISVLALAFAAGALFYIRRAALVAAWILVLLSVAAALLANNALTDPMLQLMLSIGGD